MDVVEKDVHIERKRSRYEFEENDEETDMIMLLLSLLIGIIGTWYHRSYMIKDISTSYENIRAYQRSIWMRCLSHEPTCISQLRVNIRGFNRLCHILRYEGDLTVTKNVTLEEIVASFLHIIGHDQKHSTIRAIFGRSGETVSRQFHTILRAVLKIGKLYIRQQSSGIHHERDFDKWKWFPNAVGALDGTFIKLIVPAQDRSRYRSRKGDLCANVLGACDANLKFLYVLTGWEGFTSDARVLRDALSRHNCLKVNNDEYYLVDAGYTNGPGFIAPFRATHYHLNEWRGNTPINYMKLFNLWHSSARNAIEWSFGLLKKRWTILRTANFYCLKTQIRIINACCILHNFMRDEMPEDPLLDEVDRELGQRLVTENDSGDEEQITTVRTTREWTMFREALAKQMFEEYRVRRGI